jgi:hypothetical protein
MANLLQVVALVNHIPTGLGIPHVSLAHRDLVLVLIAYYDPKTNAIRPELINQHSRLRLIPALD